jgi:TetR/AcrR family transcriptional regulator, transcriptional repressor for nem operon
MRYRPEHKQATHLRILAAAEFLFRQHGFEGASVERVMRAAGLTVGGFYAHFTSKEALLAEALRAFLQKRRERWVAGIEGLRGQEWLSHFTRRYLNRQLRDDPGEGCLMPSLLSDLTRASPEIQATFTEGLDALVREVQARLTDEQDVTARQKAMSAIALCFGAMTLARATSSHPLSNEVLEAAQAFLLGKKEAPPPPVPGTGSGQ